MPGSAKILSAGARRRTSAETQWGARFREYRDPERWACPPPVLVLRERGTDPELVVDGLRSSGKLKDTKDGVELVGLAEARVDTLVVMRRGELEGWKEVGRFSLV